LIRNGRSATLLRWVQTLPDDCVVGHPELAGAAATAATMIGRLTHERRRLLHLASRAKADRPGQFGVYAETLMALVRAAAVDSDVGEAVGEGRRAVALADTAPDDVQVAAGASLARALYFAGELDEAWAVACRAIRQPDAARLAPGYALAQVTLALVAADRGQLTSARAHAERASAVVGKLASSRSWLGANAAVAIGAVLHGEGDLAGAERAFAHAERFFRDDVPTVHHARSLIRLAGVRCQRGRFDQAEAALREAREAIAELVDGGTVAQRAAEVATAIEQARRRAGRAGMVERPSEAEFAVLRLLMTDLSARQIGAELFISPNTVRSHTRAIYRKLGVRSREDAVARTHALGFLP
jgi:LuxR family maltose regulon positive regulatory protein